MELCWVTLHVENLETSLHFYQTILGLPLSRRFVSGGIVEIAMLGKAGVPMVELICSSNDPVEKSAPGITLGFEVESLDAAMEHMKNNHVPILRGPMSPNPTLRFCYVKDPDGYDVQLVEQLKKH